MLKRIQMWDNRNKRIHIGSSFGNIMYDNGMHAPGLFLANTRFYFTENGWEKIGLKIIEYAKMDKSIKRIAVEEISISESVRRAIRFTDEYQVMLDSDAISENIGKPVEKAPIYKLSDLNIAIALERCAAA